MRDNETTTDSAAVVSDVTDVTYVTDVTSITDSNIIIHVNEQERNDNQETNMNMENSETTTNNITGVTGVIGVTGVTSVTDVTRFDSNTIMRVNEQERNDSQVTVTIENPTETMCKIDINEHGLDENISETSVNTGKDTVDHDHEHSHCQVIEVKGYSNDITYDDKENTCSASSNVASSSQRQCHCNCHTDQSHATQSSMDQSNSFVRSASQSNPVPSNSSSQLNPFLQRSSSQSTGASTTEIGLDNASFGEILRENSRVSSGSVKPPTYQSLGEFYLNDEPPKYEAITGKKLADQLVSF